MGRLREAIEGRQRPGDPSPRGGSVSQPSRLRGQRQRREIQGVTLGPPLSFNDGLKGDTHRADVARW